VRAIIFAESGYNPTAVSNRGAMGLMQLMPATARRLKVSDPFDVEQNVRAGVREFSRLVSRYSGNLELALAAYNAGEGAVQRYQGIPPYSETRGYVARILTIYTGKPYRPSGVYRAPHVRMMRDPTSGQAIITNQIGDTRPGVTIRRSSGAGGGLLRGGFGSSD
jgi:hypothetical protein